MKFVQTADHASIFLMCAARMAIRHSLRIMVAATSVACIMLSGCATAFPSHQVQGIPVQAVRRDAATAASEHRHLLQSSNTNSTTARAAQTTPSNFSTATIFQEAQVTFRLSGSDAVPFTNATLHTFQHSLQTVFSNYTSTSFQYQSAMVSN